MLQENQLDCCILASLVVAVSISYPEPSALYDHIRFLGWCTRGVSSPRVPGCEHCDALTIADQLVTNVHIRSLPVVSVQTNVLLSYGESAGGAAPVGRDSDATTEVSHVPACLMVQYLHAQVSRLALVGDTVAEALGAALRISSQQSKVSRLTLVTPGPGHMSLTLAISRTLTTNSS